jgi:hypothetical protein
MTPRLAIAAPMSSIEAVPKPPARKWARRLFWLSGFILLFAFLTLSLGPATPRAAAPSAAYVRDARAVFHRVRNVAGREHPDPIFLTWTEAQAVGSLIGRAAQIDRVSITRDGDDVRATASMPLRWGPWINVDARVTPNATGFPGISAWVGHLPIPSFLVRGAIWVARAGLRARGVDLPPMDDVVRSVDVSSRGVTALMMIPKDTKFFKAFNNAQFAPIDTQAVAEIYCQLAAMQQRQPDNSLAAQLRRGFAMRAAGIDESRQNRATLIAIAMLTGEAQIGKIAGDVYSETRSCRIAPQPLTLLGRPDLAKHWSISAALAAIFGPDIAQSMGTWKEVSDSGPQGSGFSFVDLSADRSGIHTAGRALDVNSAGQTAAFLAGAQEQSLLPIRALAFSEGMTEQDFQSRYISTESAEYDQMIVRIDSVLAR